MTESEGANLSHTAATFFDYALDTVLRNEGGLVESADAEKVGDPGGETYKGITKKTLEGLGVEKSPSQLTDEEVRSIYFENYWGVSGGPRAIMPASPGLALAVFDAGVQHGPRSAIRWLQAIVGTATDGIVGPKTLKALDATGEGSAIVRFHEARRVHLTRWVQLNPSRIALLTGLISRVDLMERTAFYVLVDEMPERELRKAFSVEHLTRA